MRSCACAAITTIGWPVFAPTAAILPLWGPKGGLETLVSYGLGAEEVLKGIADAASAENVRRRFVELLPQRHKDFMLGAAIVP